MIAKPALHDATQPPTNLTQWPVSAATQFQLDRCKSVFDGIFCGGFWSNLGARGTFGTTIGYHGKIGFLNAAVVAEHAFDNGNTMITIGLIDQY